MSVICFPEPKPAPLPWWYPPRVVDVEEWLAAMREVDGWCPTLAEAVPCTMAEAQARIAPWRPEPPNSPRRPSPPQEPAQASSKGATPTWSSYAHAAQELGLLDVAAAGPDFSGLSAILSNIQPRSGVLRSSPEPTSPPPAAEPRARGQSYADLAEVAEQARPRIVTDRLRASADYVPSEPLEPGETHEAYLRRYPRPLGTVPESR